jgi:transposase
MYKMSTKQHQMGRKAFALFPLRRSHVPRHVRFDHKVLDDVLKLGCQNERARKKRKEKKNEEEHAEPSGRAPKRKKTDMSLIEEKVDVFMKVVNLRKAFVHRILEFEFSFTTDGVSMHLNMQKPSYKAKREKQANFDYRLPVRGIHSIDALKARNTKIEDVHTIGIDPGKRELIVAVDQDKPDPAKWTGSARTRHTNPVVRYTLAERQKDMRTRQYTDEGRRTKPPTVVMQEEDLSAFNSKAPGLEEFARFASARRRAMRETPEIQDFYDEMHHRDRRRKTRIKMQKSESKLIKKINEMHDENDPRKLVLAYGAWGLVAGRPNTVGNKGTPPAIGSGLMKKLAIHFVVAPTPEHYTSKTCVKCMGPCGPHKTLKTKNGKEIRGLRVCQHEGCGLLQNRDKTGATNIGLQFVRLLQGDPPIHPMDETELELHRLNVCLKCDDS